MSVGRWRASSTALAVLLITLMWAFSAAHSGASATGLPLSGRTGESFQPEPVPPGMVSRQQAIRSALHFAEGANANRLPSGVQVRAYFGIYTDTLYTARPVWIVRFWGPGIAISGSGGPMPLPGTPYCEPGVAHEELVVVDGKTGKYLEAMVGFAPQGLPTIVTTPAPVPTPCPTRPPNPMTPWSVAVGARGNLFIAGFGGTFGGVIQKRTPSGRLLFSWSNSGPNNRGHQIIHIALDGYGNVYVANDDNLIQKYSPSGHLLWAWWPEGHKLRQTMGWWTLGVAPNGTAYAESRYRAPIDVLSPTGKVIGQWPGHWDFLAVDGHGTLYAANVRRGLIQAFSPSGHPLRHWLIETSPGVGTILSITTGSDGSVYVLELRSRIARPVYEVARFSPTGRLLGRGQIAAGPGPHQILDPRDLAVGPRGTIFIADSGNPRISAFSVSGRFLGGWQL